MMKPSGHKVDIILPKTAHTQSVETVWLMFLNHPETVFMWNKCWPVRNAQNNDIEENVLLGELVGFYA